KVILKTLPLCEALGIFAVIFIKVERRGPKGIAKTERILSKNKAILKTLPLRVLCGYIYNWIIRNIVLQNMLSLNLPAYEHKIKKKEGKLFIWDRIRKKYIVLQPEEWVRQHFINFLIETKKVPVSHISLEQGHQYNSLAKRTDILVW